MAVKKRSKQIVILFVCLFLMSGIWPQQDLVKRLLLQPLPAYGETAAYYVNLGRQAIEEKDIVAANTHFLAALGEAPSHQEASLYYSVTRIVGLAYHNEFNDLLDQFGVDASGRNLYNWTAQLPMDMNGNLDLPSDSPTGGDLTAFIENTVLTEIDAALANLNQLEDAAFNPSDPITVLTPAMLGSDTDMEVDYGDVAHYRSLLHMSKAVLTILISYDLNIDIDEVIAKINNDTLDIRSDIINAYPQLLELKRPNLADVKDSLIQSIDAYLEASDFIRNEEDFQGDDLIYFNTEKLSDENKFRWILNQIRASMLSDAKPDFTPELAQFVDLGRFFDKPLNLRDFLYTESVNKILEDHLGYQIDWALAHLNGLAESYTEVIGPSDYPIEASVEIDFGDIALLRSALYASRAAVKTVNAYDIDVNIYDIIEVLKNEIFNINNDILKTYPDFLTLLLDHKLVDAKNDIQSAINNYLAGSDYIRAEADDQTDDLIVFDAEALNDDLELRSVLSKVQTSLEGEPVSNPLDGDTRINIGEFYDDPISLRAYLPAFDHNNQIAPNTLPDPSFSGILPDLTQEAWNRLLDLDSGANAWSISGTVTDSKGHKLEGIEIKIFDSPCWGEFITSTVTDSNGTYEVQDLNTEDGIIYLQACGDCRHAPYVSYWWNDERMIGNYECALAKGIDTSSQIQADFQLRDAPRRLNWWEVARYEGKLGIAFDLPPIFEDQIKEAAVTGPSGFSYTFDLIDDRYDDMSDCAGFNYWWKEFGTDGNDGTYTLLLRFKDGLERTYNIDRQFQTIPVVDPSTMAAGLKNDGSIEFTWDKPQSGLGYQVQIYNSGGKRLYESQRLFDTSLLTVEANELACLEIGESYEWQIKTLDHPQFPKYTAVRTSVCDETIGYNPTNFQNRIKWFLADRWPGGFACGFSVRSGSIPNINEATVQGPDGFYYQFDLSEDWYNLSTETQKSNKGWFHLFENSGNTSGNYQLQVSFQDGTVLTSSDNYDSTVDIVGVDYS